MNPWVAAAVAFSVAAAIDAVPATNRRLRARIAHAPADRWAAVPVPAVGGVGIAAGSAAALWALGADADSWRLFGAAAVGLGVGFIDDVWQLTPLSKLAGQGLAAALVAAAGLTPDLGAPGWVEAVLAAVWVLIVVNAFNLIDNMDGLAAGTALIAAVALLAWSVRYGDFTPAAAVALSGATAGFLVWNVHPARLFMGDSGSLLLGVLVAGLTLQDAGRAAGDWRFGVVVPIVLLAYPVFDMSLVVYDRLRRGDPISRGGRDHSSHRLARSGWSQRWAVGAWWSLAAVSSAVAYLAHDLDAGVWWSLAVALGVVYMVVGYSLLKVPADG